MTDAKPRVIPLHFEDEVLATLDLPAARLTVTRGVGSGLSKSPDGRIWAVGDRGPNLKVDLAVERYGLSELADHHKRDGAKLMPFPAMGPAISELHVSEDAVELGRALPLLDGNGTAISGLPPPGGPHCATEPAIGLSGETLPPDPEGADTEGLVALADGGFWVGDEYGPSLIRVGPDARLIGRWVPEGSADLFEGAGYPVEAVLPPLAAKRRLNRGFEALGVSPDQRVLYLAFQSPLSHPDDQAHAKGRWVRFWKLDAASGALLAQYVYPLEPPASFGRDSAKAEVKWSDLKVSELTVLGPDRLLVLERGSDTTKLFLVELADAFAIDESHLRLETRPTLEELSASGGVISLLPKRLILDTDDHPEIGPDLEGMVMLSPQSLLIVNDNDFGTEGVPTCFWRIEFAEPI